MRLPDGREVLLRFAAPLDITVVAELCGAVSQAAERLGYTDVQLCGNDQNTPTIVATPPARPHLVAAESRMTR